MSERRPWPIPLDPPAEEGPPPVVLAGEEAAPRPSLETLADGSRWLHEDGTVRRVAAPGTAHWRQRFAARGVRAWDQARAETADEAATDLAAIRRVCDAAEGDDVALLQAAEASNRSALVRLVRDGIDATGAEAARSLAIAQLLHAAYVVAVRRQDPSGFEELDAADARWR